MAGMMHLPRGGGKVRTIASSPSKIEGGTKMECDLSGLLFAFIYILGVIITGALGLFVVCLLVRKDKKMSCEDGKTWKDYYLPPTVKKPNQILCEIESPHNDRNAYGKLYGKKTNNLKIKVVCTGKEIFDLLATHISGEYKGMSKTERKKLDNELSNCQTDQEFIAVALKYSKIEWIVKKNELVDWRYLVWRDW